MNDAIIKGKHYAGSGEAPVLEGYLVSGKNCYLSNYTASTEEHCHILASYHLISSFVYIMASRYPLCLYAIIL